MVPTTPLEIKNQFDKEPAVGAIRVCLDRFEPALAIKRGLVPSLHCRWQNDTSQIAQSVISVYLLPNSNKSDKDCGGLPRNKTDMAFFYRGSVAQMRNELEESPGAAYRT